MSSAWLGKQGESVAEAYMLHLGFYTIAKNFRHIGCELDLVVGQGPWLVFVEVKTRRSPPIDVSSLLNSVKKRSLQRGAQAFLSFGLSEDRMHQVLHMRFDLILISPLGLQHWEDVC